MSAGLEPFFTGSTIDRRPRYPPQPPTGQQLASPTPATDSAQDLVPGDADRTRGFELVQASIEFCALGIGELNRLGLSREAVPQLLQQTEPLLRRQRRDVELTACSYQKYNLAVCPAATPRGSRAADESPPLSGLKVPKSTPKTGDSWQSRATAGWAAPD